MTILFEVLVRLAFLGVAIVIVPPYLFRSRARDASADALKFARLVRGSVTLSKDWKRRRISWE